MGQCIEGMPDVIMTLRTNVIPDQPLNVSLSVEIICEREHVEPVKQHAHEKLFNSMKDYFHAKNFVDYGST